jgi:hypothetical protein
VGYTHTEDHRVIRVRGKSASRPAYRATFTYPDGVTSSQTFKRKRDAVEWLARLDVITSETTK